MRIVTFKCDICLEVMEEDTSWKVKLQQERNEEEVYYHICRECCREIYKGINKLKKFEQVRASESVNDFMVECTGLGWIYISKDDSRQVFGPFDTEDEALINCTSRVKLDRITQLRNQENPPRQNQEIREPIPGMEEEYYAELMEEASLLASGASAGIYHKNRRAIEEALVHAWENGRDTKKKSPD